MNIKSRLLLSIIASYSFSTFANSRISCDNDGWQDYNCRLTQTKITDGPETDHTDFTVHYDFACRSGSFPTSIVVKSGSVTSDVFMADSIGSVRLSGYGPLTLADDPAQTSSEYFTTGCKLLITSIDKRASAIALEQWARQARAEIAKADGFMDNIDALENVKMWYELYINDEVTDAVLKQIAEKLEAKGDLPSKLQAKKLREVIEKGSELNLQAEIADNISKLESTRAILAGLNAKFVREGKGSQDYIAAAITKVNNILN